ncbi:MAG: IclR family transcriptional regulator [Deltaproteobacteria bacterium]|nr:IclR family transcriptional regulator [Deltaproteobacteria bacterium]
MKRDKDQYSIQSVENALDVLEQFLGEKTELGVSELGRNLNLQKNNIFRILATLEKRGYIEQNRLNENYRIGIKVLELGQAFLSHTGLIKVAHKLMEELCHKANETIYLGIIRYNMLFYIEDAKSTQALMVQSRIGSRVTPFYSAIGKVVMANCAHDEQERILQNNKFYRHTDNSIMSRETLLRELALIREKGYAIDNEEMDIGVVGVAGPIFNYDKQIVAGISISGPALRMTKKALQDKFIPHILEYSKKISTAIGYTG